ncbi:uncharacterized protein LOC108664363 isoform X2 [Hyalella azteca]|uniref:Uncharacterized protein LOC108664363 isoform X1 n=1 Tax=Hyalella azteca TaxID=294128 RepID=A0A8B7MYT6_HYAAZ|nr:uncharacterized protein LOC108664363 isoform X1 [Hyalella azteca]XP_018006428.1 uncharacterized protein LOC108664363 isoform X2 [Hyalella azteca]
MTSSIEQQLAEYRLKKQKEAQEKDARRRIMTDNPTIIPRDDSPSRRRSFTFFNPIFDFFDAVGAKITNALYVAVAPEHLQRHAPGGRTLRLANDVVDATNNNEEIHDPLLPREDDASDSDSDQESTEAQPASVFSKIIRRRSRIEWAALALKIVLWLLLWKIFIIWQFGAVFFLFSGFVFIGCNLRTSPRAPGEVSAYSVFNRDLRRIDGTVSAEQLQREMLFTL